MFDCIGTILSEFHCLAGIPENVDPYKVRNVTTSFSLPGFNLSTFRVAGLIFV
tara:strand:+ start:500 stop:658 length:159 start_codon:yes stop_codon:yes gene_type:complete